MDVPQGEWHRRLEQRNQLVAAGQSDAYYVDEGLAAKFEAIFEPPNRDEIQVWVTE